MSQTTENPKNIEEQIEKLSNRNTERNLLSPMTGQFLLVTSFLDIPL
jgi:hypothetical protein